METSSRLTGATRPKVRRCEMISVALRTCRMAFCSSRAICSLSVTPIPMRSSALLMFPALDLGGGLSQVAHDVDHGLAAAFQTEIGLVRVLKNVQEGAPRIVEPVGLAGEPAAVPLVVAEDVEHGLALVAEALVELVEVGHDVEHRATLLVALA